MSFRSTLEAISLLDSAQVNGKEVIEYLRGLGLQHGEFATIHGDSGSTDFVKVLVPGSEGKSSGGHAPTLGVIGRLGGIGARHEMIGLVSDGDGAVSASTVAAWPDHENRLLRERTPGGRKSARFHQGPPLAN